MTERPRYQRHLVFCVAALAVWLVLGWPTLLKFTSGTPMRGSPIPALWVASFAAFGVAMLAAMLLELRAGAIWTLLIVQVAAVVAMAIIVPWAMMSVFLIIPAWQVAMATDPDKALGWVVTQTLMVIAALAQALKPDLCYIVGLSFALQLCFVFTARALRLEAEAGRKLRRTNAELQAAQAILSSTVRDAERIRIARELHDAWGHELTALGLQLEIASNVSEPSRTIDHVLKAKGLSRALLAKVRDVVSELAVTERRDLKAALEALAQGIPTPTVHVACGSGVKVGAEHAHALIRCAQEAITNAIRHADAANLWLEVTTDHEGVRLVARDDGQTSAAAATTGTGLRGMRERLEGLGGRLAITREVNLGFRVEAWLPAQKPQCA